MSTESRNFIEQMIDKDLAEGVYTVSGQKVNESSLEILPKGVYIVNGKKVFKK